ncbi:MAG: hypothetical protein E7508_04290 [Ruminococcus sp.]|nr:hypothetical protein [Ruminococcus sp.]
MSGLKNYKKILNYLPQKISCMFKKIPYVTAESINEIRLRVNRPVSVTSLGENLFVTPSGALTSSASLGIICTLDDIAESFRAVCDYSVHSYQKEISLGYITTEGGNRVGICGTAVGTVQKIETVKYISGLNFRIANEVEGSGEKICRQLFEKGLTSVLVTGVPLCGKTTVLRDICRILGKKHRISIIDERGEIAACYHGVPQNNIGDFSDVLNGYDKKNGIETAIRVMSPELVVCDEIGGKSDCEAILASVNSGVRFLASVHGRKIEEILQREHIKKLICHGIFEYAVLLDSGLSVGQIKEIRKIGGE